MPKDVYWNKERKWPLYILVVPLKIILKHILEKCGVCRTLAEESV